MRELGLRDASDPEIFRRARAANAVVMTKDRDKASFELICHRYERKSLLVTSNQPFRECHEQRHHRCSPAEARRRHENWPACCEVAVGMSTGLTRSDRAGNDPDPNGDPRNQEPSEELRPPVNLIDTGHSRGLLEAVLQEALAGRLPERPEESHAVIA